MTGKRSRVAQTTDRVHVDELEASTAWNPDVGAGTPDTALEYLPSGEVGTSQWAPIRKVAVAAVAGALVYVASRLGVELPSDQAQEAAQWLVPVLAAYLWPGAGEA